MQRPTKVIAAAVSVVVVAFAADFVAGTAAGVRHVADGVRSIDVRIGALGLLCSGLAMINRGMLNRAAHQAVGLETEVGEMTHTAAVGFAAQKMVKSAGAIGLAVFVRNGRRKGYEPGTVAAACVLTAAASFMALGVLLLGAIGVLVATGRFTGWWLAAMVGFSIYATLVAVLATVLVRSRDVAAQAWRWGQRARRRLPGGGGDGPDAAFPTELFEAVATARRRPAAIARMFGHAVVSKALGAVMLAAAVLAAGLPVSAHAAVVIYATALAASMVTIVPGGFGTVEASTAALLMAAGATAGAAALGVTLFRLFDLWLPVLAGAVAARGVLRPEQVSEQADGPRPPVPLSITAAAA